MIHIGFAIELTARIRVRLDEARIKSQLDPAEGRVRIPLDHRARLVRDFRDTAESVSLVEERSAGLFHDERLVNAGAVGVAGDDVVRAVQLEQDVFVVVDGRVTVVDAETISFSTRRPSPSYL
jgi:hypothetical protein